MEHTDHDQDKDAPIFEISLPDLEKFLKRYELTRLRSTVFERLTILVLSASGFVAALAWDDALKGFFKSIVGLSSTVADKFVYAIFITIIAVVLSVILGKRVIKKREDTLK